MKSAKLAGIVLALGSMSLHAASLDSDLQVEMYSDFVVFESLSGKTDLQVEVAGPGGFSHKQHRRGSEPVFVDLVDASGTSLPDGLYKYQVFAVPKVIIPREVSAAMPDRNDVRIQDGPVASPVTGTFRVQDGVIVDALEVEDREAHR